MKKNLFLTLNKRDLFHMTNCFNPLFRRHSIVIFINFLSSRTHKKIHLSTEAAIPLYRWHFDFWGKGKETRMGMAGRYWKRKIGGGKKETRRKGNKNVFVNRCLRLTTSRGPYLCNISWIHANWFKLYHAHKNTQKPMCPWLLTYDLDIQ